MVPPESVTCIASTTTSITFVIVPPVEDTDNETHSYAYDVLHGATTASYSGQPGNASILQTENTTVTIDDLTAGVTYLIEVFAIFNDQTSVANTSTSCTAGRLSLYNLEKCSLNR